MTVPFGLNGMSRIRNDDILSLVMFSVVMFDVSLELYSYAPASGAGPCGILTPL